MGLKPRPDAPIELAMNAHGSTFARQATIDLRSGHCSAVVTSYKWRNGEPERVTRELQLTLSGRSLTALRTTATSILAAGSSQHREQFAQMTVSFRARSRDRTATADFDIDIGSRTVHDSAWDAVFNRVNELLTTK